MTDEDILVDFYEDEIFNENMEEQLKSVLPHCNSCDYRGEPYMNSELCPKCGSVMTIPKNTYGDDIESDLRDIGIDPEEILTNSPHTLLTPHR